MLLARLAPPPLRWRVSACLSFLKPPDPARPERLFLRIAAARHNDRARERAMASLPVARHLLACMGLCSMRQRMALLEGREAVHARGAQRSAIFHSASFP